MADEMDMVSPLAAVFDLPAVLREVEMRARRAGPIDPDDFPHRPRNWNDTALFSVLLAAGWIGPPPRAALSSETEERNG